LRAHDAHSKEDETMNWLEPVVLVAHLIIAAAVCGFVLMQHGKGADMGAAFGSGSSGSLFGAAGSANFLSRTTAVLATIFFLTSIGLTFFGTLHGKPQGLMEQGVMEKAVPAPKASDAPAPTTTPGEVPGAPGTGAAPASGTAPAPGGTSKPGEVPK
jgi:preprotein translocase subunit SecG